jgi:alpha/beta superfamily hydrolase
LIPIEFPCGKILLEGIFSLPEGKGPFPLLIVCHPHPLYGGNMANNVVAAVCERAGGKGLAWLKFNFRGVGRSGGRFGNGIGEKEDVRAAVSFGQEQPGIDGGRIGLCGYSFGSLVAFAAAVEDPRIRAIAGISPFIQPEDLLQDYTHSKLFVWGDRDGFLDPKKLGQQVEKVPEPKEVAVFPGADHFWGGQEAPMAEKVVSFFVKNLL